MISTYSDAVRAYSTMVADGYADTDLDQYTRTLVSYLLNTASNAPLATNVRYADSDRRPDVLHAMRKHLGNVLWDASHLMYAAAPKSRHAAIDIARDRAFAAIDGI